MKREFYQQVFEKHSNIKFNENLSCGSRVVPRRTDRHEANSRFSQLCERAYKPRPNMRCGDGKVQPLIEKRK
jgi:hypothetical protein